MAIENRRDVIISALACGGGMKCSKASAQFAERPVVIKALPSQTSPDKKNGSILDLLFESEKLVPRRVALFCVGDGTTYATQILRNKKDAPRIDTVFVIDGRFTRSLKCWLQFCEKSAPGNQDSPKLWLAGCERKEGPLHQLTAGSRILNHGTYSLQRSLYSVGGYTVPGYITEAEEPKKIRVYSGNEEPKYKFFHEDTFVRSEIVGNAALFEYEGNKLQDHLYLCNHVQPRFWRWLSDLWKDPTSGVFYA